MTYGPPDQWTNRPTDQHSVLYNIVIVVAIIVITAIAVVVIVAVVVVEAVVDGCILLKQISSNRKSTNCIGKINITVVVVVAVVVVYDFY